MEIIGLHNMYLTIISITIILVVSIVLITLAEFPNSANAQGEGGNMTSSLTPEQKAAICNPNDKFVNDTESRICGIPPTPTNTTTSSSANTTTTENSTSSTIAPSAIPST